MATVPTSGGWFRILPYAVLVVGGLGLGFVVRWTAGEPLRSHDAIAATDGLPNNPWVEVTRGAPAISKSAVGRVLIAQSEFVAELDGAGRSLQAGDVVVLTPGASWRAPSGAAYLDVKIRPDHPPGREPARPVPPEKNRLLHQARDFVVYEEQLEPGETRPAHTHATRLVVVLNATGLRGPTGQVYPQVPATVKFIADAAVHDALTNSGRLPLRNIVVEFTSPSSLSPLP